MLWRGAVLLLRMWYYDLYRSAARRRLLQIVHTGLHHRGRGLGLYYRAHHLELGMALGRRGGILLRRLRWPLSARRIRGRLRRTRRVRGIRRDVLELGRRLVHPDGMHLLVGGLRIQSLVDLELGYRCRS